MEEAILVVSSYPIKQCFFVVISNLIIQLLQHIRNKDTIQANDGFGSRS